MNDMMAASAKKLMIVSGRAYPELAEEVAAYLGIKPTPSKLADFANGEIFVRFLDSVRGCDVFVLQSHTSPINEWIMEQLIIGRCPQEGFGQADHGSRAVLRLRAAGQEEPRPRADLGPAHGGPVRDRRG